MAYEVTATRRRPQDFDSLVGQEFVAATLKNAIQSGKIAHAYLFSGPRGCGKTSSARILAKALNCQQGPAAQPCGRCIACQEITRGSSLDVIEIDGASNTSVNDIRQIKDEVLFPPNSCRYKIYIIDEVHMLSTSAFNALLKTIEEPPPYVIFIFATTELHKVPATIKSRCQQFHFRLVAVEQLKELLAQAAAEIGLQAEDEALYWIAREATGSVRDAYTLFDQVASFSGGHITFDKIRDTLGLVGLDTMNQLFESCAAADTQGALEQLESMFQSGISIEQLVTDCSGYLRCLLLISCGITKEALLGQAVERYSPKVLEAWKIQHIERALSLFLDLYRSIRYSTSPRYEIDLAISRLCGLSSYISPQEIHQAVEQARQLLSPPLQGGRPGLPFQREPAPIPGSQPPSPPRQSQGRPTPFPDGGAVPPKHRQDPKDLGGDMVSVLKSTLSTASTPEARAAPSRQPPVPQEQWKDKLVETLSLTHASTASALLSSEQWQTGETTVLITAASSFAQKQLQRDKAILVDLLSSFAGRSLQVEIQAGGPAALQSSQQQLPPSVEILCTVFKGTVIGDT